MNKDIDMATATGEWIQFMNAGDKFYENNLNDFYSVIKENKADMIYRDIISLFSFGRYKQKASIVSKENTMPFCHQAALVKATLYKKQKFDLTFKICADRHLFSILFQLNYTSLYIPKIITEYDNKIGMSATAYFRHYKELAKLNNTYGTWKYMLQIAIMRIKQFIKFCYPKKDTPKTHETFFRKNRIIF